MRNVYNVDWHFMLVDSFYLNAAWHYPFDERRTTAKDFYVNEHTITQVGYAFTFHLIQSSLVTALCKRQKSEEYL